MPAGTISQNIFEKCLPARSSDLQRCGDPTLCDISPTTSSELESIYQDASGRWRIMGSLLEADFVGKACEIRDNGFYDFLRANARPLGTQKLGVSELKKGLWEVQPFVKMETKGPINNNWWTVTNGVSGDGTVNGVTYNYRFQVQSQGHLQADANWFPDKMRVTIRHKTAGGSFSLSRWRVVFSRVVLGSQIEVYVVEENTGSGFSGAIKTPPVGAETGLLLRMTPNVSDYERHCPEIPATNTTRHTPFWIETTRLAMCDSELWRKFIGYIKTNNPLYETFLHVDDVERNKQITEDFQKRHANAFLFNSPLPNQNLASWDSLDTIQVYSDEDFGNYINHPLEGRCIGRRANAVGIWDQLNECGRIQDAQGVKLNIPEFQKLLYELIRVRQDNGVMLKDEGEGPIITAITDSFYAKQIAQGFYAYFKTVGQGSVQYNIEISTKKNAGAFGFFYQRFSLDYPQMELRIATHPFFDDYINAMRTASGASAEGAARSLWLIDWSTNYQGVIMSNTVTNNSGNIQDIAAVNEQYMCVMKVPKESRQLRSLTYTNVSECPRASYVIENLSGAVPEHEGESGDLDYLGDYPA